MSIEWLSAWYNWPFIFTFLIGILFVGITLLGVDHDTSGGIDLNGDGAPDIQIGKDFGKGGFHWGWLAWLGVGKAPVTVLLEVMLITFGMSGLLVNAIAMDMVGDLSGIAFPISLIIATISAVKATKGTASLFGRYAPPDAPTSRKSGDFLGCVGVTATSVTRNIGQVRVKLTSNEPEAILNACIDPKSTNTDIQRGINVLIVGYDSNRRVYHIVPDNMEM